MYLICYLGIAVKGKHIEILVESKDLGLKCVPTPTGVRIMGKSLTL